MLTPTTFISGLLLLVLSLVCLGSWANAFKASRWRFELFYFDFAIGAVILAVVAAYTLGTMGSDLGFADRMVVAGRMAQAWAFMAGILFNLGNMLLVGAIALIGMSSAFPLSAGVALIIFSSFHLHAANLFFLAVAILVLLMAVVFGSSSCVVRGAKAVKPARQGSSQAAQSAQAKKAKRPPPATSKAGKGVVVAILGGVSLGLSMPVVNLATDGGDFGLDPYATILLFSLGILISTIALNFVFMNVTIEGSSLTFRNYAQGKAKQHIYGWLAGIICVGGLLSMGLARLVPVQAGLDDFLQFIFPAASILLALFWGITIWKESRGAAGKGLFTSSVLFLAVGIVLIAMGLGR